MMILSTAFGEGRKPIPGAEALKKLPADGGEEYNRLVFEKSPYLLQHAGNPVDWWPWGDAAFEEAKKRKVPVFLSIGYSTCHWCHVMEHESFEDPEIAKFLNENYICIKVDREERPDIDQIYMNVTVAMNEGRGGWPMTVIMTPERKPFFAGTYFPKPAVLQIGRKVVDMWASDRTKLVESADNITNGLNEFLAAKKGGPLGEPHMARLSKKLLGNYDSEWGGFGNKPKFPSPHDLSFLTRYWKRSGDAASLEAVENTLTKIRMGGVYDQVGFGLHRYSTDREWFLPHFEKMLYDQALFAIANIDAYQATGKSSYRRTAEEVFTYVMRDMQGPEGGFYSAEDAQSEGEEGKFYLWDPNDVRAALGKEDGDFVIGLFGITDKGTFTEEATGEGNGKSIPYLKKPLSDTDWKRLEPLREKLFQVREKRVHPMKDDKVLTDWNGLMIAALARGATAFDEPRYTEAARKAADFVLKTLRREDGRLLKRYRQGDAALPAHLEDYAFMVWGLLNLYEASFDTRYLGEALALNALMEKHFWDAKDGAFFQTADDSEKLILRNKDTLDGAMPCGNSVAALNLVRLARFTGNPMLEERSVEVIKALSGTLQEREFGSASMFLSAVDFLVGPFYEVVIAGKRDDPGTINMLKTVRERFQPNKVVLFREEGPGATALAKLAPFTENQGMQNGLATAFVCRNQVCDLPTNKIEEMLESLDKK